MHELSVALGIVNIAENETKKAHANSVELIEIEIGALSGIEMESLNFVWQTAVNNTVLEHAVKKVNIIEGKARCIDCDTVFKINHLYDSCPKCHSYLKGILQGKELRVKALEVI